MTKEINWKAIKPGRWFRAKIKDTSVSGRIQKEDDEIFLCQNSYEGSSCKDKLGFSYSWTIGGGSLGRIRSENVTDLRFLSRRPRNYKKIRVVKPVEVAGRVVEFEKGQIVIGCTTVPNAIVRKICRRLKK